MSKPDFPYRQATCSEAIPFLILGYPFVIYNNKVSLSIMPHKSAHEQQESAGYFGGSVPVPGRFGGMGFCRLEMLQKEALPFYENRMPAVAAYG